MIHRERSVRCNWMHTALDFWHHPVVFHLRTWVGFRTTILLSIVYFTDESRKMVFLILISVTLAFVSVASVIAVYLSFGMGHNIKY